jgi:putative nucleotidyltransferase with HDIG domain
MPIVNRMEARMGAVCDGDGALPEVPGEWPLAAPRTDPVEWQAIVDEMARRRSRVIAALASRAIASPEALDHVLVRLHRTRPNLLAHARRVARYAAATAQELRLPPLTCLHVARAALVHDLGKLTLPDALRAPRSPYSSRELMVVRSHPTIGADIARSIPYLRSTAPLVAATHERFGGGGHPGGLAGEAIPLGARVIAVADAWDAFAGDPDERDHRATGCANLELVRQAGSHFDPAVVRAWLRVSETLGC